MSIENESKINRLLKDWPKGTVYLTSWLIKNGYSAQLLNRYKNSGWIESIGVGAAKRSGDDITIEGAMFAIQNQSKINIHLGGKTALSILGKSHYLEVDVKRKILFGDADSKLPSWIENYPWGFELDFHRTSFLPYDFGFVQNEFNDFSIRISGTGRAIMECLYLTPEKQNLIECYEIMEGLNNLRPDVVQQLLEKCTSIKVKRLFLYMADKSGHPWLKYLDLRKIDLGSGNRSVVKNGVFISKYKLVVPEELEVYGTF